MGTLRSKGPSYPIDTGRGIKSTSTILRVEGLIWKSVINQTFTWVQRWGSALKGWLSEMKEQDGVVLAHSHTQSKRPCHACIFFLTSISLSTMCTQPSDPFVEPFYSLKKAFTRLLSPIPESADRTSINIAHPSFAPPTLTTPSLTIHAVDIIISVPSKILSNLPTSK